jgi:hypothetical protein
VFHIAAWGRVAFGTLRDILQTKNRFDRQALVCRALHVGFRSFGDVIGHPLLTSDSN